MLSKALLMLQQNKIYRIYLNYMISLSKTIVASKEVSNHVKNVLRIKNDQDIKIFNGDGKEYYAKVQYKDKSLIIYPYKESRTLPKNEHQIILAQCISSYRAMDLALQKSTELGIDYIVPIISARSHPGDHTKKVDHWNKIIIHATEQSNGLYIPKLSKIRSLKDFVDDQEKYKSYKICFNIVGRDININDINHKSHVMLIGPEGGFNSEELDLIQNKNWNIISLGDRIFRTETASIVAQTILRGF